MNNRELKIKLISDELIKFELQIRNLNSQNLYDINIVGENIICNLLNLAFDLKLININKTTTNYPSVDLVDDFNRIAVQVSSDKSKNKIQATLDSFQENNLSEKYDKLIFFILGEKQKRYSPFDVPDNVSFNIENNIFDFKSIIKHIGNLSIEKIEQIYNYLISELSAPKTTKTQTISRTKFKQIQSLKKKLGKDLIKKLSERDLIKNHELLYYDPSRIFLYDHLLVRSIEDKSFPDYTYNDKDMPSWIKLAIWDFYENGLEFVAMIPRYVVIQEDDTWYLTDDRVEDAQSVSLFYRIPYENIVDYTMETDGYFGYPSLFVEYANNGVPYEQAIFGLQGYYNHPTVNPKSRKTYYLDPEKEIKK